jgi:hypothetical protein
MVVKMRTNFLKEWKAMVTAKSSNVDKSYSVTIQRSQKSETSIPIRVKQKTKAKLDHLLKRASKDRHGRRVKPDDLIYFGLGLITDEHISRIRDESMSNKDRLEQLYLKLSKEQRGLTRDEFLGKLLEGKVSG